MGEVRSGEQHNFKEPENVNEDAEIFARQIVAKIKDNPRLRIYAKVVANHILVEETDGFMAGMKGRMDYILEQLEGIDSVMSVEKISDPPDGRIVATLDGSIGGIRAIIVELKNDIDSEY